MRIRVRTSVRSPSTSSAEIGAGRPFASVLGPQEEQRHKPLVAALSLP